MTLVKLEPWTRVNDRFITRAGIDATPVANDICHPLIPPYEQGTQKLSAVYKQIAADIVAETVFHYPYPCITEKTLRPIQYKRMFILLAPQGCLQLLRAHGFLTWNDIIDETYDNISDPQQRFMAVVRSIEKFCDLSLADIKCYYRSNSKKFDHNWQLLRDLPRSRPIV